MLNFVNISLSLLHLMIFLWWKTFVFWKIFIISHEKTFTFCWLKMSKGINFHEDDQKRQKKWNFLHAKVSALKILQVKGSEIFESFFSPCFTVSKSRRTFSKPLKKMLWWLIFTKKNIPFKSCFFFVAFFLNCSLQRPYDDVTFILMSFVDFRHYLWYMLLER